MSLDIKSLEDQVEALWRNNICPTLVLDALKGRPIEGSSLLRCLREAVQSNADRRLADNGKAFIQPVFSKDEPVLVLEQFSAARDNYMGEEVISSFYHSAGSVLEIPLLRRLAAEFLLHSRVQLFLKIRNPQRRVLLYKLFAKQIVVSCLAEKFGLEITIPVIMIMLEANQKLHFQNLRGLAATKQMPVDQLPPLSVLTVTPEEKLVVVDTGGRVDFEHKLLAEYFLGRWLARHRRQCPRLLLHDMFRDTFDVATATLNWSLLDALPLHAAQGDEGAVDKPLSPPTTDGGGRSAPVTECRHPVDLQPPVASGDDLSRKDAFGGAMAVKYADMPRNGEFVDLDLVERANIANIKFFAVQNRAMKVLIYALVCLCQFIRQRQSNLLQNLHLPHSAAVNNSKDVTKLLLEKRCDINQRNENGFTLFRTASRKFCCRCSSPGSDSKWEKAQATVDLCGEVKFHPKFTGMWRDRAEYL